MELTSGCKLHQFSSEFKTPLNHQIYCFYYCGLSSAGVIQKLRCEFSLFTSFSKTLVSGFSLL